VNVDTPADVVVLITIAGGILAGLLWLIRAQVTLMREFRPNGGGSTKDALNRIESDVRELRARLDNHMDNHGGRS
jgi:hypothetical protein